MKTEVAGVVKIGNNETVKEMMTMESKYQVCKRSFGYVKGFIPNLKFSTFYRGTFYKNGCWHYHGHYDFTL